MSLGSPRRALLPVERHAVSLPEVHLLLQADQLRALVDLRTAVAMSTMSTAMPAAVLAFVVVPIGELMVMVRVHRVMNRIMMMAVGVIVWMVGIIIVTVIVVVVVMSVSVPVIAVLRVIVVSIREPRVVWFKVIIPDNGRMRRSKVQSAQPTSLWNSAPLLGCSPVVVLVRIVMSVVPIVSVLVVPAVVVVRSVVVVVLVMMHAVHVLFVVRSLTTPRACKDATGFVCGETGGHPHGHGHVPSVPAWANETPYQGCLLCGARIESWQIDDAHEERRIAVAPGRGQQSPGR